MRKECVICHVLQSIISAICGIEWRTSSDVSYGIGDSLRWRIEMQSVSPNLIMTRSFRVRAHVGEEIAFVKVEA